MIYLLLFWEFLKIGFFTVGGGLATLPFLYELAGRYDWFTEAQVADMVAVAECTPGPLAINMATYAGVQAGGIPGGIIATLGVVFPSVVIILLIAAFLQNFAHLPAVVHAFNGIRACVCALILSSLFKLGKSALKNRPAVLIFLTVLLLASLGNSLTFPATLWGAVLSYLTSPVVLVLLAGIAGFLLNYRKGGPGT